MARDSDQFVDVDEETVTAADRTTHANATLGDYTWQEFMQEHGFEKAADRLYEYVDSSDDWSSKLPWRKPSSGFERTGEWADTDFDPAVYLDTSPSTFYERLEDGSHVAATFAGAFAAWNDARPVTKDEYTWESYRWEWYYDSAGRPPRDRDGSVVTFEPDDVLGFDPDEVECRLATGARRAVNLAALVDTRTVTVNPNLDEDEFFRSATGTPTLVDRFDLEKAVPATSKPHFVEVRRYWVDKPYAFVIIFHSIKENEKKYFVVDPYLNQVERDVVDFLSGTLRTSIKHADDDLIVEGSTRERGAILLKKTRWLIERYNLGRPPRGGIQSRGREDLLSDPGGEIDRTTSDGFTDKLRQFPLLDRWQSARSDPAAGGEDRRSARGDMPVDDPIEAIAGRDRPLSGLAARPEPAVLAEDSGWLSGSQMAKILYVIRRDFLGYQRIDPIKCDINVEDISCDGYDAPVFVYHTDYENLITNVSHGRGRLDNFVIKLAQRSGKGISKRTPQIDATLPDGSRAQLTLGTEVSDHGTNYTIRQFKDVPFTPVDLINWNTFSLAEMAFLWLCIESNRSLLFAGGTASGKTTSLNAVSLFIPSTAKIVSIEDTREVELPQRNWVASVTRPSFSQDNAGEVDEFDLLEAALRQRPDYIVMGEVRGEEGRTLFQVMSTGHTTYTTFHADTVDEVIKRFTTDPINVSKTLFTALDLIAVQTQTSVRGRSVRRNKTITEINDFDAKNDEISVQDIFSWHPEQDSFVQQGRSETLESIAFDRGWSDEQLKRELRRRQTVLAYLIANGFNEYTDVAATIQAFITDPETTLSLVANGKLGDSLDDLRGMESVHIDVDPMKEAMVPRPEPDEDVLADAEAILADAEADILEDYRGADVGSLLDALAQTAQQYPTDRGLGAQYRQFGQGVGSAATKATEGTDGTDGTEGTEGSGYTEDTDLRRLLQDSNPLATGEDGETERERGETTPRTNGSD